jgi:hypothetical protein
LRVQRVCALWQMTPTSAARVGRTAGRRRATCALEGPAYSGALATTASKHAPSGVHGSLAQSLQRVNVATTKQRHPCRLSTQSLHVLVA